jgi:hypothetical protein
MEDLLEQVVDLPSILWHYDRYNLALKRHSKLTNELNTQLVRLRTDVVELEAGLRSWKRKWADTYLPGQLSEVLCQGIEGFPIFRYLDPVTLDIVTPLKLVYPDLQLAPTLCMYYAAMLLLSSVHTGPVDVVPGTERLEFAHLICRSLEYYIQAVPSAGLMNCIAFPLAVAYDSLPEMCLERRFVEEVFKFVERKSAFTSWRKFIQDFSMWFHAVNSASL